MDLFSGANNSQESNAPLAARMRPQSLDEYIGQDHIVGKGRLLRRAIQADQLTSIIFCGPPGSGKTTLARVIANHTKSSFITLNAVLSGVQQIRESISQAEQQRNLYNRKTILFVDEVHRWNKAQQDALLPWVENGTIILIGATTENPFFEVNKALVSRSRVFQLAGLTNDDLYKVARAALTNVDRGYGKWDVSCDKDALDHLVTTASGDARSLLNALELAVETSVDQWPPEQGTKIHIDISVAEESIQKRVVLYDRDGDYHYDIISAFIKSLRGRDPDAALYWLARMVLAGEDPNFIFRRMLISACEDTGLADPHALSVVESCAAAFDRVGLPEGKYHLAHAALYLATAPKSNSSLGFFDALSSIQEEDAEIPVHLRDGSRDSEAFSHGKGYLYPHSYRHHWVAQQYLPNQLVGKIFYTPSTEGYEKEIRDEVLKRRELQVATILESEDINNEEVLTFSPRSKTKDQFISRLESGKTETLLHIRDTLFKQAGILRHHRVLILNADDGLLLWEAMRLTPEGCTAGLCKNENAANILQTYSETLEEVERPVLAIKKGDEKYSTLFSMPFDRIISNSQDVLKSLEINNSHEVFISLIRKAQESLTGDGRFVFSCRIPQKGMRLSSIFFESMEFGNEEIYEKILRAESMLFEDKTLIHLNWNEKTLEHWLEKEKIHNSITVEYIKEHRHVSIEDIHRWLSEDSRYGRTVRTFLRDDELIIFFKKLEIRVQQGTIPWEYAILFCTVTMK